MVCVHVEMYTEGALQVYRKVRVRPPLKKSLFPVQRVAEIMASRAAAKSFFFFFVFGKKIVKIVLKKKEKIVKNEKKRVLVGPHRLTRSLDRKQHFFLEWPKIEYRHAPPEMFRLSLKHSEPSH